MLLRREEAAAEVEEAGEVLAIKFSPMASPSRRQESITRLSILAQIFAIEIFSTI
jgi:hypothetical protein